MDDEIRISHTNGVFEQEWWLRAVSPEVSWKEIKSIKDEVVLGRWIVPEKGDFVMPHLTQTIGYWINPELLAKDTLRNEQKKVLNELLSQLPKNVHVSLAPENYFFLPFLWAGFTIRPYATYRINDMSDLEGMYASFPSIVKKNIKSAKNKVGVIESDDISILHSLMEKTFEIQNRKYPFSIDFLSRIYEASKSHDAAKLLYAQDKDGNIHSGVLFVYDEKVCYYLIAGTDPQFRSSGANTLLIWEGIRFASEHSKCFDFEGSMIEGVENFFRQFGGELTVYYDIYRQGVVKEVMEVVKPRIKKLLHYK